MIEKIQHFGVWIKKSEKNRIDRQYYAQYDDEYIELWGELKCKLHQEKSLINFDKNMQFFKQLSKDEFEKELKNLIDSTSDLIEIFDLNKCKNMCGIYIMVLDNYKQVYIGQSTDIKRRILQHWSKNMDFYRLLWGDVNDSVLSINSFGALDTTRIFVVETNYLDCFEKIFVSKIPSYFRLNRIGGGTIKDNLELLEALAAHNYRSLGEFHNEEYAEKYEKEKTIAYFDSKQSCNNINELTKGDIFCMERTDIGKLLPQKYYGEIVKVYKTKLWVYRFCSSTLHNSCDLTDLQNREKKLEEIRIKKTMIFSKVNMVKKKEVHTFWRSKKFPELEA